MTEQPIEQLPGQQPLFPESEPQTPEPVTEPEREAQTEPDPTSPATTEPDASSEPVAASTDSVSDGPSSSPQSAHRFRIIHELHGGPGADIIRVGEELATDAATAIKFLENFVTK